jgi:phosphatidate phosphatase APP1
MFYRKLHWVLAAVVLAVAVIQIFTGNLLGAILPLVLAAIFASIAADYPIIRGARRAWKWLRRLLFVAVVIQLQPAVASADNGRTMAVIYNGIGTTAGARIWGRAMEHPNIAPPTRTEGSLKKAWRTIKLMETDELPGAKVEVKVLGRKIRITADAEGFFTVDLKGPLKRGLHPITAAVLRSGSAAACQPGHLNVLPKKPGVAVISDMDDTLLRTGVANKARMVKRVLLSNSFSLRHFSNAPALYKVWATRGYPLVFVSGSPYNLYSRLTAFLHLRGLPPSPIRLKDFGTDSLTEQVNYKVKRIEEIMALLPGYRFILVGDSGEKDPEIYRIIQAKKPEAVIATLIHRVSNERMDAPRFKGQVMFNFYSGLARKLAEKGLLTADEVKQVEATP